MESVLVLPLNYMYSWCEVITRAILRLWKTVVIFSELPCFMQHPPFWKSWLWAKAVLSNVIPMAETVRRISVMLSNCQCLRVKLNNGQQSSIKKFTGADLYLPVSRVCRVCEAPPTGSCLLLTLLNGCSSLTVTYCTMFSVSVVIITATTFSTCVVAGHILQFWGDFLAGVERGKAEQVRWSFSCAKLTCPKNLDWKFSK